MPANPQLLPYSPRNAIYSIQFLRVPFGNGSVVFTTNPGENLLSEHPAAEMLISAHVIGQLECCAECLNANLAPFLAPIGCYLCHGPPLRFGPL